MDEFYRNPGLQAAWGSLILYPVCLKVTEDCREFVPVKISRLGDGEQVLEGCPWGPVPSLEEWECIEELFRRKDW